MEWGADVSNAFEESLAAAWVSGAFHVMDLDGNGTDEVLGCVPFPLRPR